MITIGITGLEQLRDSLHEYFFATLESVAPQIRALVEAYNNLDVLSLLDDIQKEKAFREYAQRYNGVNAWRKISWRRLNKNQKRDAALEYISKERRRSI